MSTGTGRAFLAYNVARVALFALAVGVFWAVGFRGLPMVASALLVSGVASWFLLGRQRMAIAEGVEGYYRRARQQAGARAAAEDAAGADQPPQPQP